MKTRFYEILLACVPLVVLGAGGEFLVRYLEPESGVFVTMANEGSSATLVNIPGTEGIYCGRKVTINSEGYRGPLYEEKREREFRILVFGDSHTFGIGAGDEDTWPAQLEKYLQRKNKDANIINLGVPGMTLKDMKAHFDVQFERYTTDLVIFTHNLGDMKSTDIFVKGDNGDELVVPADNEMGNEMVQGENWNLRGLLREFRKYLLANSMLYRFLVPRVLDLLTPDLIPYSDVGNEFEYKQVIENGTYWKAAREIYIEAKKRCTDIGVDFTVVLYPPAECNFQCYAPLYDVIGDSLENLNISTINPINAFTGKRSSSYYATLLDHHPNEDAYAIVAKEVGIQLIEMFDIR